MNNRFCLSELFHVFPGNSRRSQREEQTYGEKPSLDLKGVANVPGIMMKWHSQSSLEPYPVEEIETFHHIGYLEP